MNCPKCKSALHPIKIRDIELDQCEKCYGLWFDEGELKKIAEMELTDIEKETLGFSDSSPLPQIDSKQGDNLCPRCANPLREINYMYETNIKVDSCEVCHGLWLDFGELAQIAKYLSEKAQLDEKEKEKYLEIYKMAKAKAKETEKKIDNAMSENLTSSKVDKNLLKAVSFLNGMLDRVFGRK